MTTTTTSQTWTEDTPTFIGCGAHYGQHTGPADTPHLFRWVYSDFTPARGSRGLWQPCRDCS